MAKDRKERIPFGGQRTKLQVPGIKGYSLYWFSDKDTRIQDAENAGYEFVYNHEIKQVGGKDVTPDRLDQGEKVTKTVGTTETGAPLRAYLMKIKKEWHEADKAAKARQRDEMEQSLLQPNIENRYNAKEVPGGIDFGRR